MHQRDATTEHFGKALSEIVLVRSLLFKKKKKKKKNGTAKGAEKGFEDSKKSEGHISTRDYKLALFSPADQKPREARIAPAA